MEIKVYGPGCARCAQVEKLANAVAQEKGGDIKVSKISGIKEMMSMGIMSTPAISIDGQVKASGRIPGKEEIAAWIDGAKGDNAHSGGCCCGGKC